MKSYNLERTIKTIIPKLVEKFTVYYGEEYREKIVENLSGVDFYFDSSPDIQYAFINKYPDLFSKKEIDYVMDRYYSYRKVENVAFENAKKELFQYINDHFFELGFNNILDVISLFSNFVFETGIIDSFSSENLELLARNDVSDSVKELINKKQNDFLEYFNRYSDISREFMCSISCKIDEFLKFRNGLRKKYQMYIIENSDAGKSFKQKIERSLSKNLENKFLINLFSTSDLCALSWSNYNDEKPKTGCLIKICWVSMRNKSKKYAFLTLIHELIHAVESNGDVGIVDGDDNNVIINEIRTQMLAKKIVKELYDEGFFGFEDNSFDDLDKIECNYEYMFPVVSKFLNKYDDIIKKCAIDNDSKTLITYFGETWNKFSKRIDEIYNVMVPLWRQGSKEKVLHDIDCSCFISKMEEYYNKYTIKKL